MKRSVSTGRRYWLVGLILAAGVFISYESYKFIKAADFAEARRTFEERATDRLRSVGHLITTQHEVIHSVVGLFDASQHVDRGEFKIFLDSVLYQAPAVQALEWIPRVAASERPAYEAAGREDGFQGFQFTELSGDGEVIRAGPRGEYFPVYFVEPYQGNERALGFDLGSNPARRTALENARDTGDHAVSERIELIQGGAGVVMFAPIYRVGQPKETVSQRRQHLRGFAVGVFNIEEMVERAFEMRRSLHSAAGIDVYLYDDNAARGRQLLYFHSSRARAKKIEPVSTRAEAETGPHLTSSFSFGDRTWTLLAKPVRPDFGVGVSWVTWSAALLPTLLAVALAAYLLTLFGRSRRLEQEITERKRAEELARTNEARLNEAQRIAHVGSWERDIVTGKCQWSDELRRIFDLNPDDAEMDYETMLSLVHPDDVEPLKEAIRRSLEENEPFEMEYRIVRPNGEVRTVLSEGEVTFDEDANPIRMFGTLHDVTERKWAEDSLKASEARLAGILDIEPEAVIAIGAKMNIRLFNQSAERIFGYDADDVIGRPLDILMPERFRDAHRKHVAEFDRSEDTYRLMDQRQDIVGLRKDGTEFPASASVSKLEINGEMINTVLLQDITKRKEAEKDLLDAKKEAERASYAKSEFLAAMSHELRTPLNAILGFADILSQQYFGPIEDKYREYAEDIQLSGEHLLSLVNDILDLSTIEAGKQSLVKVALSTEEIVAECEKIVQDKARSKGIELVTEVPEDLLPLYADRRAAKQILLNLLSNAVKFTPEGGKITVSVKASKRNTTFMVSDTGKGIPAERLPKLTDPFTRADPIPIWPRRAGVWAWRSPSP